MPEITKHKPGAFSWIELSTTDQDAAKSFYTSLFGWTFEDSPMGPTDVYTMFSLDGRISAAAYTQRGEELAQHVPPHWNLYINVESADDTVKRATELGGKVIAPPFDVYTYGRMAIIQDPTGAVFSAWQDKDHTGIGVKDEPGTLCWADLNTPDQQTAATFYSKLLGWEIETPEGGSGYLHIKNGADPIGGIPPAEHQNPNTPPHWLIYFLVSECDASTDKAKELGGRVLFGPTTMEKVGRLSIVADPQGAVFSLFESRME